VFQSAAFDLTRRPRHWHGGDEWADMEEVTSAHDSSEGDPERAWQRGRIFKCTTCDEQFLIPGPDEAPPSQGR
jgi:hypothetical protein